MDLYSAENEMVKKLLEGNFPHSMLEHVLSPQVFSMYVDAHQHIHGKSWSAQYREEMRMINDKLTAAEREWDLIELTNLRHEVDKLRGKMQPTNQGVLYQLEKRFVRVEARMAARFNDSSFPLSC